MNTASPLHQPFTLSSDTLDIPLTPTVDERPLPFAPVRLFQAEILACGHDMALDNVFGSPDDPHTAIGSQRQEEEEEEEIVVDLEVGLQNHSPARIVAQKQHPINIRNVRGHRGHDVHPTNNQLLWCTQQGHWV